MKSYFFKEIVCIFSFLSGDFAFGTDVPAVLWNVKGNALNLQPISAFDVSHRNFIDKILKEMLNDKSTSVLIFLLDKLSMEDFSTIQYADHVNDTIHALEMFLDQHPHMLLPAVTNPTKQIYNKKCGLEEIHIDKNIAYNELRSSLSSAVNEVCVTVVHLHDSSAGAGENEERSDNVKSLLHSPILSTKKNVIGIVTAEKPSWDDNQSEQRKSRSLLEVEEPDEHFINASCIVMYVNNITVEIGDNETIVLSLSEKTHDVQCGNSTVILDLSFKADDVDLKFTFDQHLRTWFLNETIFRGKSEEVFLEVETLEAPLGFSFSCGNLVLTSKNSSIDVKVTINRFQIEPFVENGPPFSESFDCVTFFTLPIWMGLFVIILFTIILSSGIYALFSVKTMDRFDDPKGKTISVPTSE